MGMVFIDGINGGYPCIEGLAAVPAARFIPPYGDAMMMLDGSYPVIRRITKATRPTKLIAPYPEFMMYCLGEEFNSGYPCILKVEGIKRGTFSKLYFGTAKVGELYFGDKKADSAYCNGQKVYGSIYVLDN